MDNMQFMVELEQVRQGSMKRLSFDEMVMWFIEAICSVICMDGESAQLLGTNANRKEQLMVEDKAQQEDCYILGGSDGLILDESMWAFQTSTGCGGDRAVQGHEADVARAAGRGAVRGRHRAHGGWRRRRRVLGLGYQAHGHSNSRHVR